MEVVSQFQDSGVVLYEQYGDGTKKSYDVISGGLATKIPMVVLINEGTASASEITAGALQDYGRAKLVGVVSYGKGSVQNWVPISNDQGAVRVTIARWLTPKNRQIDKKGLTPDVYVTAQRGGPQSRPRPAAGCSRTNIDGHAQRNGAPNLGAHADAYGHSGPHAGTHARTYSYTIAHSLLSARPGGSLRRRAMLLIEKPALSRARRTKEI